MVILIYDNNLQWFLKPHNLLTNYRVILLFIYIIYNFVVHIIFLLIAFSKLGYFNHEFLISLFIQC
jgi:hypothetical protein